MSSTGRLFQKKVKMIGHKAVAEKLNRIFFDIFFYPLEKLDIITMRLKDGAFF